MAIALERSGHTVLVAENAPAALDILRDYSASQITARFDRNSVTGYAFTNFM